MFPTKLSISLLFAAIVSLLSFESATARDVSALKMSFSNSKISVSHEHKSSKPRIKQKNISRNISQKNEQKGWYIGTVRGASFPNLSVNNSQGNASWSGIDSLGGLIDFSNLNVVAGYKSSNLRIEGELFYGNNSMKLSNNNNLTVNDRPNGQTPNGIPTNCKATTFAAILNGYYDLDTGSNIKPFVGAGIGFASTNLKDGNQDWGSASGLTYQVKAGVGYPLSEIQDIYLQYRYLNVPAQYVTPGGQTTFSTTFNSSNIEFGTKFNF
jgi:opacity protein-like surface antigen